MPKISDILTLEKTRIYTNASSKKKALELVAETLAHGTELQDKTIFTNLVARERLGSTAIGQGIAIPHSRLEEVDRPLGCFILLQEGVDFNAEDKKPVDILFGLLVPQDATDEHLEILSLLAKTFQEQAFNVTLRQCTTREALYKTLCKTSLPATESS